MLGKTYVYTYDNAGNRTSKTVYAYTPKETSVAGLTYTSTESYSYASSGWGDRLITDGSNTYTYDAAGNLLNYGYNTFTWDGRQLVSVMDDEMYETVYTYNDEGIRTSKTSPGTTITYILEGSRIVGEMYNTTLIVYLYDENGSPIGMQCHSASMAEDEFYTFYYEKNLQGDIIAIYNESGVKLRSYTYDAWGNFTTTYYNSVGSNLYATFNRFFYRGYYYDFETGLYYLQSRYYSPQWGRFISADGYVSTGTGLLGYNMYAYCNNNPVMYVDLTGRFPWLGLAFVAVVCLFALRSDTYQKYESTITAEDININNSNPDGEIKVAIGDNSIHIKDSYVYSHTEDKEAILDVIEESEAYKSYGYNRTRNSYIAEWVAHNWVYGLWPRGDWGNSTRSVDFNRDTSKDPFAPLYRVIQLFYGG